MEHASYFAQWFPIDSQVEVQLVDRRGELGGEVEAHLLCGTVVLVTAVGIIVEERDGVVLAPWGNVGLVRASKAVAS